MAKNHSLVTLLVYGLIVGWLSLQQGTGSAIGSYDKLAHFLTYAVFALLAARLGMAWAAYLGSLLLIVVYSGLLEVGQSFVPGRDMSLMDLLANAAGVVAGAVLSFALVRKVKASAQQRIEDK